MAIASAQRGAVSTSSGRSRMLVGFFASLIVLIGALAVAVAIWSGATLSGDETALAHLSVQPFAGKLQSVRAYGPNGHRIPMAEHDGLLTPLHKLSPGEQVSVEVTIKRPGWLSWALGAQRSERLTLNAPVAEPSGRWLTVKHGRAVKVSFDRPVDKVAYGIEGNLSRHTVGGGRSISLGRRAPLGVVQVATAARPWERLGKAVTVSWFPPSRTPMMVSSPPADGPISPAQPITLTFSKTVDEVLGSSRPTLSPSADGHWRQTDSHTLVFTFAGYGAPLASKLRLDLPKEVQAARSSGQSTRTSQIEWTVPPGSTLRLQQLLAQAGYLPLDWNPAGHEVRHTARAEVAAAVNPPKGEFGWRYENTPQQLKAMWSEGELNTITRGAVMKFENTHALTVDGVAGAAVWRALFSEAIAGKGNETGYSFVYVHTEQSPETLTLWHDGKTILTTPGNTGIAGAQTELGTFPVFEHIPEGTMSGTNPDGSHYKDPGIKWISYFNGGDAIHNFDRASFGTPQSLGCVELPLEASAQVWPYTPIGTLVSIEA